MRISFNWNSEFNHALNKIKKAVGNDDIHNQRDGRRQLNTVSYTNVLAQIGKCKSNLKQELKYVASYVLTAYHQPVSIWKAFLWCQKWNPFWTLMEWMFQLQWSIHTQKKTKLYPKCNIITKLYIITCCNRLPCIFITLKIPHIYAWHTVIWMEMRRFSLLKSYANVAILWLMVVI